MSAPTIRQSIVDAVAQGPNQHLLTTTERSMPPLLDLSDTFEHLTNHGEPLSAAELRQLDQVEKNLRMGAKLGRLDSMPSGSIASAIKTLPVRLQAELAMRKELHDKLERTGGRTELFAPRNEPQFDKEMQQVANAIRTEDSIVALNNRMGTGESQAALNDRPADMRDYVQASVDIHEAVGGAE